jgi:hypothetical protein
MTAHITSKKPQRALVLITKMCREKYKLYHTVIQVEDPSKIIIV